MKKIYLAAFLAFSMGGVANAQISEGGLPWTLVDNSGIFTTPLTTQSVPTVLLAKPDYEALAKQDHEDAVNNVAKPFRVAKLVDADIDIQKEGVMTFLPDGRRVWRVEIAVPNAKALDLFYDKFKLPAGVKLYASNHNKKQILGAYTSANNPKDGRFTNEAVQGSSIFIEMNIDANVALSDIQMHINTVGAYYRGVDDLNIYANNDETPARPTISSCHVNAECDFGPGYRIQMEAVVRITCVDYITKSEGFCSGSLINNTAGDCKNLILTASHCDGGNSFEDTAFGLYKFRYHYETESCDGPKLKSGATYTGASFKARSFYPSMPSSGTGFESRMVADFLLLEQTAAIPAYANYAGWNRRMDIWDQEVEPDYDFFFGFHHPGGDLKKLISGMRIDPSGTFNQNEVNNTHWSMTANKGGMEPGSSGSPLFDKWGRIIGDLSGGSASSGDCAPISYNSLYSKLSYAWDNVYDDKRDGYGPKFRLKDHLDPGNTGAMMVSAKNASCADVGEPVGIENAKLDLSGSVSLYPNPSSGLVSLKFNLKSATNMMNVEVYDISGKKQIDYAVGKVQFGDYKLDMSSLSNGVYLVKIIAGGASTEKKVVITK